MVIRMIGSLLLLSVAQAQNVTSSIVSTTSVAGSAPSATVQNATVTANASLFATSISIDVEDFWDLFIGPVEVASVNTTVSPTPVPTSELVPPPPLYYPPQYSQAQPIVAAKNQSWSFPSDFWWGVASAAYQVEGAVKDEGRGPSIWDVLTHRAAGYTVANQTGDIANNHYYLYKQDIARIAALGTKAYSFSISWSRVMPFGRGPVNEQALAHYEDVVDTCIQFGVEPIVTLFHWDLPLYLQNLYGGWLSEEIVDDFVEYARVVFQRLGPKVTKWFTVNEPIVFCSDYPLPDGYFKSTSIPAKQQPYHCGQSVLLAHSKAYRLGKSMGLNGTISFKNNGGYKIPLTNSSEDAIATQRAWDFNEGWFADPIFLGGDYPASLKQYVATFLRNLTTEEMAAINGSADLFAHDAYTSQYYMAPDAGIAACLQNTSNALYPSCVNTTYISSSGWNIGYAADPAASWLHKATDWVPPLLHYIQDTWTPRGGIAISEFGFAEPLEALKPLAADIRLDYVRSMYYHDYTRALLQAVSEGVNLVGTLAWSIFDNLEWADGYTVKFGLQYVNFTTQERLYKSSYFAYVAAFAS